MKTVQPVNFVVDSDYAASYGNNFRLFSWFTLIKINGNPHYSERMRAGANYSYANLVHAQATGEKI